MRKAKVFVQDIWAGVLEETAKGYQFNYNDEYRGSPVSLTMPVNQKVYEFAEFPAFFEGLLPEGILLEAMLRKYKLDKKDYFGQLIQIGQDVVGAVTLEEMK